MSTDYLLKHSGEALDYPFDWTSALASGETISSTSTSVDPVETGGLAIDSGGGAETSGGSGVVAPVCSAGIAGRRYLLTNEIVTSQGRTDRQERVIQIRA